MGSRNEAAGLRGWVVDSNPRDMDYSRPGKVTWKNEYHVFPVTFVVSRQPRQKLARIKQVLDPCARCGEGFNGFKREDIVLDREVLTFMDKKAIRNSFKSQEHAETLLDAFLDAEHIAEKIEAEYPEVSFAKIAVTPAIPDGLDAPENAITVADILEHAPEEALAWVNN